MKMKKYRSQLPNAAREYGAYTKRVYTSIFLYHMANN